MRLATIQTDHGPRAAVFAENRYVDLHATDREHGPGLTGELCHTLIRFV